MAKDALFKGSREVRTFVDLNHGADVLLMKAQEEERGSYYTTMGALLLRAFTFEAYLNHLGNLKIPFWAEIESIKVMEKYAVLCKHLNLSPEFSRRPYQTLSGLFKFRNAIAHGRSQILEETKDVSSQDDLHDHIPKAHWEEYSTLENAQRAKEDISQVIKELHVAAGLGDFPFIHGVGIGSLSPKAAQPVDAPDRLPAGSRPPANGR